MAEIKDLAVTTGKIGDLSVNTLKIAYGSVTNGTLLKSKWMDTGYFRVDAPADKRVLSWVQMKGVAGGVWGGAFCEIWLMRGNTELVYRKFTALYEGTDENWAGYYIRIDDFFMHMDIPTGETASSVNYWVKMRTYTNNQTEHNKIQQVMNCDWMLLEAKR